MEITLLYPAHGAMRDRTVEEILSAAHTEWNAVAKSVPGLVNELTPEQIRVDHDGDEPRDEYTLAFPGGYLTPATITQFTNTVAGSHRTELAGLRLFLDHNIPATREDPGDVESREVGWFPGVFAAVAHLAKIGLEHVVQNAAESLEDAREKEFTVWSA